MTGADASRRWQVKAFAALSDELGEIISVYSLEEHRFLYVSPAYGKISGCSVECVYRDPSRWLSAIHPDDRERIRQARLHLAQGPADEQYRMITREGGTRWIRSRACLIEDEDHGPVVVSASVDFTEKKQLGVQLAQAQKLESVGRLAAGIAHEINTPTQYVGDNLHFLREAFEQLCPVLQRALATLAGLQERRDDPEIQKVIDLAEQADLEYLIGEIPQALTQSVDGIERVSKIVQAMKDFSHPGSAEKVPTDLNAAIVSTVTVARNEWKYVAEVDLELDPELPLVPLLSGEMNQVILNLLVNAAHAISERIGEGSSEKGRIGVRTRTLEDEIEIRISDTGTGVPDEIRSRIFECFFTTKPVGRGTGQGLYIARSVVVEQHGGSITLESELGRGTEFTVRLPLTATDPPSGRAPEVGAE
ncbi:MAG: ATP-binding protein [Myxococcota bacterium]